jgi:hypothetical protein
MQIARDRQYGNPVARHHTIRHVGSYEFILFSLIAVGPFAFLSQAFGDWYLLGLPLSVPLTMRYARWQRLPAEHRRRFYLFDQGLVIAGRGELAAVAWSDIENVAHRPERRHQGFIELERLQLQLREPADAVIDLWPVDRQRWMTHQVRDLTGRCQ